MEERADEWAVFQIAPWDPNKFVARAPDGLWIYPIGSFKPKLQEYYFLELEKRISRTRAVPYYIGRPRHGEAEMPPEVKKLIRKIEDLEFDNFALRSYNEALQAQIEMLEYSGKHKSAPVATIDNATIGRLLKNCTLEDLLGKRPDKETYRRAMQVIHPDKLYGLGHKLLIILEELVKAINERYK